MASTKPDEPESDSEPMCIEDRLGSLEACIGKIDSKIDRLLAILDAKENKKLKDRMRIKHKRDEENAAQARAAGKIVVERLEGTMYTDCRLPYKQWAYIMLEFTDAREFLRWLMHTYLESYYCVRDSRRRMIVRKGNHWKFYAKGCGSEKLATPADMFGGHQLAGHKMLDMVCLRWCHVHVRPIIEHVCNLDRQVFVHQKQMAWNDPRVNDEVGAEPLPLESRWWRKGARFRETMHASLGVYGDGWIRTTKGSMLLDYDDLVLKRREVQLVFTDIARALHDGVANRTSHDAWVKSCKIQRYVDLGLRAQRDGAKADAHRSFLKSLHASRKTDIAGPLRIGLQLAAAAKEEHDIQKAIEASLGPDEEKVAPTDAP